MKFIFVAVLASMSLLLPAQGVHFSEWKNVIRSCKFSEEIKLQASNNNLDLVKYKDKYYLAFRTAPTHFASKKVWLYVVSSTDLQNWEFEKGINLNSDVREPRWYTYHDTLFLMFFQGGQDLFHFEPKCIYSAFTTGNKAWSELIDNGLYGYVPWRIHERNDTLYLSAYYGVNLYQNSHHGDLRLFTSTDGIIWNTLADEPQVTVKGAEEGEFVFDKQGNLWAVIRLEGSGSMVAYADKGNLKNWKLFPSKYKYDSSFLFEHNDDIYLLSRRNLDGEADKSPLWMKPGTRRNLNIIRYSVTRKTTALFKLNKKEMKMDFVKDMVGTGDNAYPALVNNGSGKFVVMNYSSDLKHKKRNWLSGQLGKTFIYLAEMTIDETQASPKQ
jgi:hypothetical protein